MQNVGQIFQASSTHMYVWPAFKPGSQNDAATTIMLATITSGWWRCHRRKIGMHIYIRQMCLNGKVKDLYFQISKKKKKINIIYMVVKHNKLLLIINQLLVKTGFCTWIAIITVFLFNFMLQFIAFFNVFANYSNFVNFT